MCGICGVVRFDGRPVAGSLDGAARWLHHRGPDHWGTWDFHGDPINAAFGSARLAVIDPRAQAHQPFQRNNRYTLVYNGETYNFRELRAELISLGESFTTESDTEVVLAVCARWGAEGLRRLDGMFALAFFDRLERRGFLARDRVGIKPLMYAVSGNELCFASEMQALTRLGRWRREVDAGSVVQHLVFGYIADPATIYRAAWRLPPGHYLSFGPSGLTEPRRFVDAHATLGHQEGGRGSAHAAERASNGDAPYNGKPLSLPGRGAGVRVSTGTIYAAACAQIRRTIGDAVACQCVSDVPIGAFLSGGLDSSIVVSHLAEVSPSPVHTFCVGYADARSYDEREYARLVAARFGTRHEEVVLTEREVLDTIPRVLDHLGEPVGDSSIVPTSLVSWAARQFVTVALSGDGGDELFGGYWRYLAHQTLDSYLRVPGVLRRGLIQPLLSLLAVSRSSAVGNRARQFRKLLRARSGDALERHLAWSRILPDGADTLFADPNVVAHAVQSMLQRATGNTSDQDRAATVRERSSGDRGGSPEGRREGVEPPCSLSPRERAGVRADREGEAPAEPKAVHQTAMHPTNDADPPCSLSPRERVGVRADQPGGEAPAEPTQADPLNAVLRFDLENQLPGDMLHKVDLASMMHSLEVRVPLLDTAVVEAVLPLPTSYKVYRGLRKRILVDAYRGHLPDDVLDRPKQGFEVPIGELIRGPLRELFHDTVTRDAVERACPGLLSFPSVERILDAHLSRRADHADLLWAILSLCWWAKP